ncbi:hypothetical protein GRS48_05580 [Halorubrum sp. JWXQ-INN 858]|uniref:hypothetical protein n=1 Tax=Halorubrum sp. JWXQ-INN 858 TaxID=2690782 RepID=UPI001358CA72|nr:hypothetical protein [Halorubrum sp. JWXQ-INN 858]MWV64296.1 hypothetical protein [Halorubrum sp. JWXQ-INN 858]
MKRRWFAVMGTALLCGVGVLTAAFGGAFWLDPPFALQGALLAVGGVAFVVAGLGGSPFGLDPIRLVGVGDVCVAGMVIVNGVTAFRLGPAATDLVFAVALVTSGVFLAVVGIDYLRGGVHFAGDGLEDGPLFG